MNTHDKLHLLSQYGIKVLPVIKRYKFAVQIVDERNKVYKKKVNTGTFKHDTKTINDALKKTVNFVVEKIIEQKRG